jgi:hypothetical protein
LTTKATTTTNRGMKSLLTAVVVACSFAGVAAAHEGHGATPAHVHAPGNGAAVDVGAALAAVVAGTAALAASRRRAR